MGIDEVRDLTRQPDPLTVAEAVEQAQSPDAPYDPVRLALAAEVERLRGELDATRKALRGHFHAVLGDIADSHMPDPGPRRDLTGDVVSSVEEILAHPHRYARLDATKDADR